MCCASSPDSPALPELAPGQPRGGSLAVFDLDGTITRLDTLLPFVLACLARRPWRLPRLLGMLPATVRFLVTRDRGALKGALMHGALGGLEREELRQDARRFVDSLLRRGLYQPALQAVQAHRERGDRLVLMSASPDLYVPQIAAALGFDEVICTHVRWRADGRLDGRLASVNCRGREKLHQLSALIERRRPTGVYAYGNSRADLLHMQLAQQAYLVNGGGSLRAARAVRSLPPGVQRLRWR